MMTSEPTQLSLDNSILSAEGSLANQSQWQETELESQKNPDQVFFTNSCESYAWFDPDSLSWKTWQQSLITDWTSFSESFPKQGTMQNGQLYLRVHWEPVIKEVDGGALPTPTTMDHLPQRSVDSMIKQTTIHRKGRTKLANLREAVNPQTVELFNHLQMLPTPRANEPGSTNVGYGDNLKEGICKQIGVATKKYPSLPTPTARDYKGRCSVKWNKKYGPKVIPDVLTQTGDSMSVSPYFLEEVMGYPLGWTELKP